MTKTILLMMPVVLFSPSSGWAQSALDYQIIAEFHQNLNALNDNSKLNPNNVADLDESESRVNRRSIELSLKR